MMRQQYFLALLPFLVACNTAAVINPPASNNTLGLLRVGINDDSNPRAAAQFERPSNASTRAFNSQNPADSLQVCSLISSVLDDAGNGVRYIGAVLTFKNKLPSSLSNLSFHAVHVPGNTSGTAFGNLRNFNQTPLTDDALARAIKPSHLMQSSGGITVNQMNADMQVFNSSERSQVQAAHTATFPSLPVTVLDYGFVAHTGAGARTIAASDGSSCAADTASTGRVALSFRVPSSAMLNADAYRFELRFALMTSSETSITQSLEEQAPSQNSAVLARATALGTAGNPVPVRILNGSGYTSSITNPVCGVLTANPLVATQGFSLDGRFAGSGITPTPNSMFNPASTNITTTFPFSPPSSLGMTVRGSQSGVRTGGFSGTGSSLTQTNTRAFSVGEEVEVSQTPDIKSASGLTLCSSVSRFRVSSAPEFNDGFATEPIIDTAQSPQALAVGDLNNDGLSDFVAVTINNILVVTLAKANGGYQKGPAIPVGGNPSAVVLGELNFDGKLDAVVANTNTNTISVLLGNGAGGFSSNTEVAVGTAPVGLALGLFNNDSFLDIAVVNRDSNTVSVLKNGAFGGPGGFSAKDDYAVGNTPRALVLTNMNDDIALDIVTVNASGSVSVLLGSVLAVTPPISLGSFSPDSPRDYTVAAGSDRVAVAIINSDSRPDLITTSSSSNALNLLTRNPSTIGGRLLDSGGLALPAGSIPSGVASTDLNNDGLNDLLVSSKSTNALTVFLKQSFGSPFPTSSTYPLGTAPVGLQMTDINADGFPDAVVASSGASVLTFVINQGDGSFEQRVGTVGNQPVFAALGDLNNDGKLDAVIPNRLSSNASVLLGNGKGGFKRNGAELVASNPSSVALSDLNNDGKLDAVVVNTNSNNISILLGDGAGGFNSNIPQTVGLTPVDLAIGDFNADGKPDAMVVNNISNNVSILLGDGNGSFTSSGVVTVGISPFSVALGDLNNDGKLDAMVVNSTSNNVSILLGNGKGGFTSSRVVGAGINPQFLALGDLNGDGRLDAVITNPRTSNNFTLGKIIVLLNDGNGGFTSSELALANVRAVALGDVNGDGKLDAVVSVTNSANDGIVWLLGGGDGGLALSGNVALSDPTNLALGDLNGDGRLDVVVVSNLSSLAAPLLKR
jgi:FG-GAP-like repeat